MPSPFDRFNSDAKRTLAYAQNEAILLRHNWLGTEHLMLSLVRLPGRPHDALASLGVDLDTARASVERALPRGDADVRETQLTPRMKTLIERARQLSTPSDLTPVHLLLALVADADGVGTQVLAQLGATPEKIEKALEAGA